MAGKSRVYLDSNATGLTRPGVAEAMAAALALGGNPSSVHREGRLARRRIEEARARVAALVGAEPERVVLTSGGTEANNLALHAAGGPVLVSAIEHPSILEVVPEAARLPVDLDGRLDLEALEQALARARPAVVALMLANNETGVIQPVAEAAALCRRHGARLHCDAVQGPGRIAVDMAALGCSTLALSAHKVGGPPGIGALVLAPEVDLTPLLRGGGQERRRRAGTENLPGIVGFGRALELLDDDEPARLRALRDRLEEGLRAVPEARIVAESSPRLPSTTCVIMPGVPAETQVMALDLDGIAVSAGAACSSGKVQPSHVLRAMGLPVDLAGCAIRVSLGWHNDDGDIDRCLLAWTRLHGRTRRPPLPSAGVRRHKGRSVA
jgi:cysteine desulfurase